MDVHVPGGLEAMVVEVGAKACGVGAGCTNLGREGKEPPSGGREGKEPPSGIPEK